MSKLIAFLCLLLVLSTSALVAAAAQLSTPLPAPPIGAQRPPAPPPGGSSAQPAATAEDKQWLELFVTAHGGCASHVFAPYQMQGVQSQILHNKFDTELFGKPILKWSDGDIATTLRFFQECHAKIAAIQVGRCMTRGLSQSECQRYFPDGRPDLQPVGTFERSLRETVTMARDRYAQQNAQQQAKIELEKAQSETRRAQAEELAQQREKELSERKKELSEQAERDREAAEKANRAADLERPKVEEATKKADEARRARQEAEQKLADLNAAMAAQQGASQQQHVQKQELDRQTVLAEQGYQTITVESFVLDGRDLAARTAKLVLTGIYIREGNLDVLYADMRALLMTRQGVNQPKVSLLTDQASRVFREHILKCQSDYASAQRGCAVTVMGRASTCTLTNAFGTAREEPCVAVEDEQQ